MIERYVIIGASLAGATAAGTLREEGFDGQVTLIGAEAEAPYERPALSKEYLRGEQPFEDSLVKARAFWDDNAITTVFGVGASRLDPAAHVVELEDGRRIGYDKCLIATGSRNRRLPIPGLDLPGVHGLRTIADCDGIRAEAAPGRKVVVVGMGFIGAEVAASLRALGVKVVAIEGAKTPLFGVFGERIGRVLEAIHRDHGVDLVLEDSVAALEGAGRVQRVVTKSGREIDCDFVVVGIGVEPATDFLRGTGVEVDNGVVVDEYCRTNLEGIYAAGDVANHFHPVFARRMRVEHWQNAVKQAAVAAKNMLGKTEPYDEIHWFWSDQYEDNIQYTGHHTGWDELVVRGSLEQRNFIGFFITDGLVDAAVAVNRGKDLQRSLPIIKARVAVDPAGLGDEDLDLRTIAEGDGDQRR